MTQASKPDTGPFFLPGDSLGVLLIHGFTGSTVETRPMGHYLASKGLTVSGVRLPGHGTCPEDLYGCTHQDWAKACQNGLAELRSHCSTIFVAGLSLGSLLSLSLAADNDDIAGLILMAPAIKVKDPRIRLAWLGKYFIKSLSKGLREDRLCDPAAAARGWSYDCLPLEGVAGVYALQRLVRRSLPRIKTPCFVMQGRHDDALAPDAAQIIYDEIGSTDRELVWLDHSGHNILVDGEREVVWQRSYDWIVARYGSGASSLETADAGSPRARA